MAALAVIAIVGANAVQAGSALSQRDAEEELLFIGEEFQRALHRYANASPVGSPRAPATVDELLRDPRSPQAMRHLRHHYADPMTGKADWTWRRDSFGRIVGVHSSAKLKPIRTSNLDASLGPVKDEAGSYEAWIFWGPLRPLESRSR